MKKLAKKLIVLMLMMALILSTADAAPCEAASFNDASNYVLGTTEQGIVAENYDTSYYAFTLDTSGTIDLSMDAYMEWIYMYIYDSEGNMIWSSNPKWNSVLEMINFKESIYLTGGKYYFQVKRDGSNTGNYNFNMQFTSANESFNENKDTNNNSVNTANEIGMNGQYSGQLALNDSKDFYKFTLTESGLIDMSFTAPLQWVYLHIYDSNGNELWNANPKWNDTTRTIMLNQPIELTSGTYYFCVERDSSNNGNYSFKFPFTSAAESFPEVSGGSNNLLDQSNAVTFDKTYKGQLAFNDEKDFYSISLPSDMTFTLNLSSKMEWVYIYIYDSNGNQVWSSNPRRVDTTGKINLAENLSFTKGTYYLCIQRDSGRSGDYAFSIIKPVANVKLSSLSTKSGSITVKWAKASESSGYQIQYAYDRSFSSGLKQVTVKDKNAVSYQIKKLKKSKVYYVRIRAYKTISSKNYYGSWSSNKYTKCK